MYTITTSSLFHTQVTAMKKKQSVESFPQIMLTVQYLNVDIHSIQHTHTHIKHCEL